MPWMQQAFTTKTLQLIQTSRISHTKQLRAMHEERWWNIIQRKFKTLVLFIMTQKSCKSLRYEPC